VPDRLPDAEWDQFVCRTPGGDIVQTTAWAETKRALGFTVGRVALPRDGDIAGGGQIIVKRLGPFGGIGYVARGPLLDRRHGNEAGRLLDEIESWARVNSVRHIIVQPGERAADVEAALNARDYAGDAPAVTPTATLRIDLHQSRDQMLGRMSRGRRRDIAAIQHGEIEVRIGGEADLDAFCAMHEAAGRREWFTPLSRSYLRRQWECLSPPGWLQLFIAYHRDRPVAGLWHSAFGEGVTARVAGWTGEAAKLRPNIACYWRAIQWAKEQGYRYYDFGGVQPAFAETLLADQRIAADRARSPDAFKYFFGGDLVLFPVPRQLTLNPIARAVTRPVFARLAKRPSFQRFISRFRNG
jgi:lipid II:glycine glycyltransferase (peptidoglycan interpeptide bridge formation enzyme)